MNETYLRFPNFRSKALTFSYDDNTQYDRRLVDIFNKYNLKGTFNVCSGWLSAQDGHTVTREEVQTLYVDNGHEVAVHGQRHLSLTKVDNTMVLNDILNDRIALEKLSGQIVRGMAYANGEYDDRVVDLLQSCGICYARTTQSTEDFELPTDWLRLRPTCHHGNARLAELAKKFVETDFLNVYYWGYSPKLFYVWGHSYEFENNNGWQMMEDFCKYVGNRQDVWYATNMEIYNYVKAFNLLVYSADCSFVYNPTNTDVYINYLGKNVVVHKNETVKLTD